MILNDFDRTNSTTDHPSDLVVDYILAEANNVPLAKYLTKFDFACPDEIAAAIKELAYAITGDRFLTSKRTMEENSRYAAIVKRFREITQRLGTFDKYTESTAGSLWFGSYARALCDRRTNAYFGGVQPMPSEFDKAYTTIQALYHLSANDMAKLTYFVQQVRAGSAFPASLRRMLYIWGEQKKTGKTTVANNLVAILNADKVENINSYSSTLSKELQIKDFVVPLIAYCNCVLLDECFYSDMGKTYDTFKRRITKNDGAARLVYGNEFEWHGMPNYIATSNTPLRKFIKDWDDRRFLAVRFSTLPAANYSADELYNLWRSFVVNVPPVTDWVAETDKIEAISFEQGELEERALEFEIELRQPEFLNIIRNKEWDSSNTTAPKNRLSLKFFVDYFARSMGATEAAKHRGEIERAVIAVFGERYGTQSFWLLPKLRDMSYQVADEHDNTLEDNNSMPF